MTDPVSLAGNESESLRRRWPSRRTVWRWHFYSGLLCIPFVLWLSLTGTIYLFKPQIDAWLDRGYDNLQVSGSPASVSAQIGAALAAVPHGTLDAYELPVDAHSAVRVLVNQGQELFRVHVHPQTLKVLGVVNDEGRFSNVILHLHGELMLGDGGSITVELAASWIIVMLISGLFLWWPRNAGIGGILYPRLNGGRRVFWRDLHAVTGFHVSMFALFLLVSGLPWTKSWGNLLKQARQLSSETTVHQDWPTGSGNAGTARADDDGTTINEHAGHGMAMADTLTAAIDYRVIDRMVITVGALGLPPPVRIAPPSANAPQWTARSDTQNRPRRSNLVLDADTGEVLSRMDFPARPLIDRIIGYGVAAHEGQLFGWFNQALGVFTTSGLILVSISAVVMWWRRRTIGTLGAPVAQESTRFAIGFFVLMTLLGTVLPLLGLSMIAVWLVERLVLRRIAPVREFLGLPSVADGQQAT